MGGTVPSREEGNGYIYMMIQKNIFEHSGGQIKPGKKHVQILIDVGSEINMIEKAKQIIEGLGVHIIEMKNMSFQKILLKLGATDMREIALKLPENGFIKIEGYAIETPGYSPVVFVLHG